MTMIVFVPSRDEATAANAAVARAFLSDNDVVLIGNLATRRMLLAAMESEATAMLVMAHGSNKGVYDNDDECALGVEDCAQLEGRQVFAWACNTAKELGVAAALAGATWIGYRCSVTAPSEDPAFLPGFQALFAEIKENFELVSCQRSAEDFLIWLKSACDDLIAQFEQTLIDADDLSVLMCCSQIWRQVDVRIAGGIGVVQHNESVPPSIEI